MSNTGQALENVRILSARDDVKGSEFWTAKALRYLREDLQLPDHIIGIGGRGLKLRCARCGEDVDVPTLAQAAEFRDRHWYCGEAVAPTRGCDYCKRTAWAWEERCRFCGLLLKGDAAPADPQLVLSQWAQYEVRRPDGTRLAIILCNGRRHAEVAAAAMWPEERCSIAGP